MNTNRPISQRVEFHNSKGIQLAGIIERPHEPTTRTAVFSPCFTCTKDLKAIVKISRRLATRGIAVLRFDFTGLGNSRGDFSRTTFRDNQDDVVAACEFLAREIAGPRLLIGHSLGGAAMIATAKRISTAQAIVTIASPSSTRHLAEHLLHENAEIAEQGQGNVVIGGQTHQIRREMVEVLMQTTLEDSIRDLALPLLSIFPANDETLPRSHAHETIRLARGLASLILLDGANHLITNQAEDIDRIAKLVQVWSARYFEERPSGQAD